MKNVFKINWINGLGLSFIFTAFLYFLKIAADSGWIPPELRSAIGVLIGVSGIFVGIHLNKLGKSVWGESIAGLGTAITYATVAYVGFTGLFHFSANALLISMLSIGVLTAYLAVKSDMRVFTLLATLGGLITPLIVKAPDTHDFMLFIYLLVINIGSIYLSARKKWHELKLVSFVLTLGIYSTYYVLFDPVHWLKPLVYVASLFLVYMVSVIVSTWKENQDEVRVDTYLGIINAVNFVFWATLILTQFDIPHLVPLSGVAILYLGIGSAFYFLKGKKFNMINATYLILGGLSLCIAGSNSGLVLTHGYQYVVNSGIWLLIILAMYFVGQRVKNHLLVLSSYAAMVLLTGYWYSFAREVEWLTLFGIKYIPFLNAGALVWIGLAVVGFYFSTKEEQSNSDENTVFDTKFLSIGLGLLSHVIVGGLLTVQISNLWEAYQIVELSESLVMSVCWMIYALSIFIWSTKSQQKAYTIMGSIVMGLTSLKIFFFDLTGSATYQKIIFLLVVGLITLLAGTFYGKAKSKLNESHEKV